MNVYVVVGGLHYDFNQVLAVFSSREKAEDYVQRVENGKVKEECNTFGKCSWDTVEVVEQVVQ